ncbi:DUF1819 family protein [Chryseobacterium wangxinyae]|uniref:DUF1819 family protein n=1 Tax=Chryseobacterium sp. CY353 TaxID=2997334 RepID=UPI00226F5996|nr:DUF1819 family protein [Chryseobacterium sp. CY353]MCY0970260.1 DUF1819 family protein [Chryseobacterium sp. CY353]
MIDARKYSFSFTTASLMINGMVVLAESLRNNSNFNYVEILGNGKSATGKKYYSELKKRLKNLTASEIDLLIDEDLPTQKQMCFLAVCKTYGFIKDLTIEVLRNKFIMFDYEITEGDYISFFRGKLQGHEELEQLTAQSEIKVKGVIFKILEQAGIIDNVKNKMIQPQFLTSNVLEVIYNDNPNWLKIFFISDTDIKRV